MDRWNNDEYHQRVGITYTPNAVELTSISVGDNGNQRTADRSYDLRYNVNPIMTKGNFNASLNTGLTFTGTPQDRSASPRFQRRTGGGSVMGVQLDSIRSTNDLSGSNDRDSDGMKTTDDSGNFSDLIGGPGRRGSTTDPPSRKLE